MAHSVAPTCGAPPLGSHLRAAGQGSQTLSTGSYLCHISRHGDAKGLRLQWEPVSTKSQQVRCGPSVTTLWPLCDTTLQKQELMQHTVVLPDGLPADIFYFAPPMACGFGASVSGELRALASADGPPVPRFPRLLQLSPKPPQRASLAHLMRHTL